MLHHQSHTHTKNDENRNIKMKYADIYFKFSVKGCQIVYKQLYSCNWKVWAIYSNLLLPQTN